MMFALAFPPIKELVEWPAIFLKGTPLAVNKIVLLEWLAVVLTLAMFVPTARNFRLVPAGVQNLVEAGVDFVRNSIILEVMGPEGLVWTPFLVTMFFFLLFCNIFEVIPFIQMPVTARMAVPLFLSLVVWILFIFMGFKSQGLAYIKNALFPPGVPGALKPLVAFIELISTFLLRPFTLAVRIFANMLAGHLLLVTFAVLTAALFTLKPLAVVAPLPFAMLVLMTGFEVLVAVLQAFIFTILTAVFIGGAMHPEH
jgi:F-type H+-transporting ATPase subunit a